MEETHRNPGYPPSQSWKEALDRHCRQLVSLQATIPQLLTVNAGNNEDDDVEVPWALPTLSEIVTPRDHEKLNLGPPNNTDSKSITITSTPRKLLNVAKSIVGGIYATVKHYTTDEDEYWHEPEPDGINETSSTRPAIMVPLDQPIVHVDLTRECLSAIMEHATLSSSKLAYRRPPWTLVARSDWVSWVRGATAVIFPPPRVLSFYDVNWLLDVLVANGHVRILTRKDTHKPDVVVFETDGNKLSAAEQDKALQIPLALFDLQHSMKQIEARLENLANQVQICSQKALQYKKQSQSKLALAQMARRRLLQEQIDTHSPTLLQLERVYNSIDTAQSNQAMLSLLSEGSHLLHQLSSQSSLAEIDDLQETMQEVMEQVDVTHVALTFNNNAPDISDDDLLAELASLTITDENEEALDHHGATGLAQCPSEDSTSDPPSDSNITKTTTTTTTAVAC
jgi:hypothetical protein